MAKLPDFFGMDLGHDSFKMAEVNRNGAKAKLENIGIFKSSYNILESMTDQNIVDLGKEINQAYKASGIGTANCVMSVPEVSVFSRLIKLPKVKQEEEAESIQWAIKPLIPVSLEEVNISYLMIDEIKEGNQEMVNWYVVAAPRRLIESIRKVSEKAGLKLLAIETEALASARNISFNYGLSADIIIVDMGAESTNVVLSRNGIVVFSQTTNTGSDAITKVIASDYGIELLEAEKYKLNYGMDFSSGGGKIAATIEPIVNIIVSEISRTITYFKERISTNQIQAIYLAGGGSKLLKLDEYMTQKLGIKTIVANPITNFELSNGVKKELQGVNLQSLGVAIGLGLKDS